jgi:glycolate oxidase
VVLPTGEIINTGGRVMKNVTGYDLTALFTGSEGTLGVITKIIVKLVPLPEAKKTMLVAFDKIDHACETVSEIIAGGIIPTTLELLDNTYIRNIEDYAHVGLPVEADAVLLIEVDGDREILDKHVGKIEEVCRKHGMVQIRIAKDDADAAELWRARKAAFASLARVRPTIVTEDCTVPRSQIPKMVGKVREVAAKYNLTIGVLAHAGDGNLHADILADERDQEEMGRVDQAVEEILKFTLELKGSLSGEHGIGRTKKKYIELQTGTVSLEVQHRIKQTLDPNNILNPAVMFGG